MARRRTRKPDKSQIPRRIRLNDEADVFISFTRFAAAKVREQAEFVRARTCEVADFQTNLVNARCSVSVVKRIKTAAVCCAVATK